MSTETKVVHQQEKIFTLLKMHSNDRGYVKGLDIQSIHRLTGVSLHDVTKTLWGLQKRNLVGFSEKKGTGGHSIPYRFRIKKAGFEATPEQVREAEPFERVVDVVDGDLQMTMEVPDGDFSPDSVVPRRVIVTPKAKDHITQLINRENDLRFAATILGDYGLEELGLQVLEHIKLSDEEFKQLRQYFEAM